MTHQQTGTKIARARPAPDLNGHQIGWFVMIAGKRYYSRKPDKQAAIRECLERRQQLEPVLESPDEGIAACNRILDELGQSPFCRSQAR